MLCGACGQFFGNNPIWHFDGPTLFPHKDAWPGTLASVGSRDIARLGAFFAAHPWHQLVPDGESKLVTAGQGSGPMQVTASRTHDGKLALVYVPSDGKKPRELTVNLDELSAPITAQWFNPAMDAAPIGAGSALSSRGSRKFRTPGDNGTGANDWLLVLEAR